MVSSIEVNGLLLLLLAINDGDCAGLALEPIIGAISAGNAVALKPSELAPSSAEFLAEAIPRYLDGAAVKVFLGGPSVGSQLLEQRWDKILFTGKIDLLLIFRRRSGLLTLLAGGATAPQGVRGWGASSWPRRRST